MSEGLVLQGHAARLLVLCARPTLLSRAASDESVRRQRRQRETTNASQRRREHAVWPLCLRSVIRCSTSSPSSVRCKRPCLFVSILFCVFCCFPGRHLPVIVRRVSLLHFDKRQEVPFDAGMRGPIYSIFRISSRDSTFGVNLHRRAFDRLLVRPLTRTQEERVIDT